MKIKKETFRGGRNFRGNDTYSTGKEKYNFIRRNSGKKIQQIT